MNARWFVVILPGECPETSDLFGPFQSEQRAQEVRDRWNGKHPDEQAFILPILPAGEMRSRVKYTDRRGRPQTLTRVQALYLAEADKQRLEHGWGGYRSTLTVRLLEERGLIELRRDAAPQSPWTITGLTRRGGEVLEQWRTKNAL